MDHGPPAAPGADPRSTASFARFGLPAEVTESQPSPRASR